MSDNNQESSNVSEQKKDVVEKGSENKSSGKKKPKKRKGRALGTLLRVVLWIIVVCIVIFLTLFLASRIGEFNSILDMLDYIRGQF